MFRTDDGAAPRTIPRREADALVSAALLEATQQAAAASTELLAILRGGGLVNGILEATTRTLDADGELHLSWRVPAGSAAITNHSDAEVWVTNAPSSSRHGRGATRVPAGGATVVYLASTDLTVAGAAGAVVTVVAFTGVVPPAWHGGGNGGGGGAGLVSSSEAIRASVAASVTPVTLAPARAGRFAVTVLNDSTATLYLALGDVDAAVADCTAILPGSMALYESPTGWQGRVSGVWSAASGSARVTELI